MPKEKEIIMKFAEDGSCVLEVNGVKGKACKIASEPFEKVLGKVKESIPTREYKEREENAKHRH